MDYFMNEFAAYLKTQHGLFTMALAVFFLYLLKWHIEPWVIETMCQIFLKC